MEPIDILGIDLFREATSDASFYINTLSRHLTESHRHIDRPHKHDFYAVILFTHGTGTHEIEFTAYAVQPGSLFFLAPGQTHAWSLSGDVEGYVLFHSGAFYDTHYSKLGASAYAFYSRHAQGGHLALEGAALDTVTSLFHAIAMEKATAKSKSRPMLLALLTQLYITAERLLPEEAEGAMPGSYQQTHARFLELLETHYKSEKSTQRYADRLHITAKHLNRINKSLVGKTTSELIAGRIVLEAKRLLLHTSLPLTEIAAELGYPEYTYFSKLFRKQAGVSPSQFLKRYPGAD